MSWLFNLIWKKRKDGKCRWWEHDDIITDHEFMTGTNRFINGVEIEKKMRYTECRCKKCGHVDTYNYRTLW